MAGGWFALSRAVWDFPGLRVEAFSEREALIWLLSSADYEGDCRGQLIASRSKLATTWHWSESRVERFLQKMEKLKLIQTGQVTGQQTGQQTGRAIRLIVYEELAGGRTGNRTGKRTGNRTEKGCSFLLHEQINKKKESALAGGGVGDY